MKISPRVLLLFAVVTVAAGMFIRYDLYIAKNFTVSFDEATMLIAGTGHRTSFEAAAHDVWKPAAAWKRYFSSDGWKFARIADDLAHTEVHPPLYYWVFHIWANLFDVSPTTGASMNLVIVLPALLMMYLLSRQLFGRDLAAAAALLWLVSPQVFRATGLARPYEFVGLGAICFAYFVVRTTDRNRSPRAYEYWLLAVTVFANALLHFSFVLTLAGGVLLLLTARLDRSRNAKFAIALLAGLVAAYLAHPDFYLSFRYHGDIKVPFRWEDVPHRLEMTTNTLLGFLGWRPSWTGTASIAVVTAVMAIGSIVAFWRFLLAVRHGDRSMVERVILCLLVAPGMVYVLAFNTAVVDAHAMNYRYLAFVWPFAAIAVVAAAHAVLRTWSGPVLLSGLCAMSLLFAVFAAKREASLPEWARQIRDARVIILDNAESGTLPAYLIHARDDARVYVGSPESLLQDRDAWLPAAGAPALLISKARGPEGKAYQEAIRSLIAAAGRTQTEVYSASNGVHELFVEIR